MVGEGVDGRVGYLTTPDGRSDGRLDERMDERMTDG